MTPNPLTDEGMREILADCAPGDNPDWRSIFLSGKHDNNRVLTPNEAIAAMRRIRDQSLSSVGRDGGWQPIETAPKDGAEVLFGFQGQFKWVSFVGESLEIPRAPGYARPTHWQPLPEPPIRALKAGDGE